MPILRKRKPLLEETKMKGERYCPSKKAYFEGDRECYYHGEALICPYCGQATKPVRNGKYESNKRYTLRELGRPGNWKGSTNGG